MGATLFDHPLFVQRKRYIEEIVSLQDAFDLLAAWPGDQRGLPHEVLVDACHAAAAGAVPLSALRANLERFLRRSGRLAKVNPLRSAPQRSAPPSPVPSMIRNGEDSLGDLALVL